MQDTLVQRLRDRAYSFKVPDPLVEEAANEIERLRQERNHWMAAAQAFDDHLATMRVMMMEHPQPTLTEEELKAIRRAAAVAGEMHDSRLKAALGGLLERTK